VTVPQGLLPGSRTDRLFAFLGFGSNLSLHKRLGMLAALAAGVSVLIVSVASYWTVRVSLYRQVDTTLTDRAQAAAAKPGGLSDPRLLGTIPSSMLGAADVRLAVITPDSVVFDPHDEVGTPSIGAQEMAVATGMSPSSARTVGDIDPSRDAQYRVVAVPVPSHPGSAFVMAQPLTGTTELMNRLGLLLGSLSVAGIALASWAGFAVARSGLRPIQDLTVGAELVARTGQLQAVPVHGDDELARLARSFNTMLAALGEVRERERRLIADAGHELRTPLTSMRTNIELLQQAGRQSGPPTITIADEDRQAMLDDVHAQLEELTGLVGDLVELARDIPASSTEELDFADIVDRALERVQRRAPGIRFAVDITSWPLLGERQSLERAVLNLLDNAAKWSPPGGTVTVSLHDGMLSVGDQGPGIAEKDLPHVFDRFYRSPEARAKPGSGLGLAIVAQAAARHGGSVGASRSPGGGAELTLRLPTSPENNPG
jgi:two-component system sensor histidine kinase MprB